MSEETPQFEGLDASGLRVGIAAGRFNEAITSKLLDGARAALREHGAADDDITVAWVAGAFEIPQVLRGMAVSGEFDALVGLGAVVRGDTPHFDFVAGEAGRGSMDVALETGVAVAFGVLTTDTFAQAEERAGGAHGNKGAEAALTAVETARILQGL